jgi:hypothetical protein
MQGAREYAEVFSSGQYGRLYIEVGSHARGSTFYIYVLPEGEDAFIYDEGYGRKMFNQNAVKVYGILGGQPGWTEYYGWLYPDGKWVDDFNTLYKQKLQEKQLRRIAEEKRKEELIAKQEAREAKLLADYK